MANYSTGFSPLHHVAEFATSISALLIGDGPAVFVAFFGGFIVLGAALWTELAFEPPFWVHLVIFLPMTLIVCVGLLRPLKGLLIALQYRNKAEQGRPES